MGQNWFSIQSYISTVEELAGPVSLQVKTWLVKFALDSKLTGIIVSASY